MADALLEEVAVGIDEPGDHGRTAEIDDDALTTSGSTVRHHRRHDTARERSAVALAGSDAIVMMLPLAITRSAGVVADTAAVMPLPAGIGGAINGTASAAITTANRRFDTDTNVPVAAPVGPTDPDRLRQVRPIRVT